MEIATIFDPILNQSRTSLFPNHEGYKISIPKEPRGQTNLPEWFARYGADRKWRNGSKEDRQLIKQFWLNETKLHSGGERSELIVDTERFSIMQKLWGYLPFLCYNIE